MKMKRDFCVTVWASWISIKYKNFKLIFMVFALTLVSQMKPEMMIVQKLVLGPK